MSTTSSPDGQKAVEGSLYLLVFWSVGLSFGGISTGLFGGFIDFSSVGCGGLFLVFSLSELLTSFSPVL
jgi:hypothetical protein